MPGPRAGKPRPASARMYVGLRMTPESVAGIDSLAWETGWQRSEVLRYLIDASRSNPAVIDALRAAAGRPVG